MTTSDAAVAPQTPKASDFKARQHHKTALLDWLSEEDEGRKWALI